MQLFFDFKDMKFSLCLTSALNFGGNTTIIVHTNMPENINLITYSQMNLASYCMLHQGAKLDT